MNSETQNWQDQAAFNELWIIDRDTHNPWFAYFDSLTQLEFSRNARAFKDKNQPWIFSGAKFLPAALVYLADFSEAAVVEQQAIWKSLGSPKTLIFSDSKTAFTERFTAIAPNLFCHIKGRP